MMRFLLVKRLGPMLACTCLAATVACSAPPEQRASAPAEKPSAVVPPPAPAADGAGMGSMSMSMTSTSNAMNTSGVEIPSGDRVPTVALKEEGHANGVWSFRVVTDLELTASPGPYRPMRGHIHVYVDGQERLMITSPRFTLAGLSPGPHTVGVSLAATNHRTLLHRGKPIADSVQIQVLAPK